MQSLDGEKRLQRLMDNLPGMAYTCRNDREWTMMFVSSGCQALTGYSKEEIELNSTVSYAQLIHPDDRSHVWDAVQVAVLHNQPFQMTYRIITKQGEEKWVWERGCPVWDAEGRLVALEGFICDVTNRVRAEQALRVALERLNAALEAAADGVWDWDLTTNQTFFSPRWFMILDYEPDELKCHYETFRSLVHPEDLPRVEGELNDCLKGKRPALKTSFRMRARNGEWRWILSRGKITQWNDEGKPLRFVGTNCDITEEVENQERQAKLWEQIQYAHKLEGLGVLGAGIGHNFNNLLMAVLGNVELAQRQLTSDHPVSPLIEEIEVAARRMAALCHQIMDYAGKSTYLIEPTYLPPVLQNTVELFRASLSRKIILTSDIPEDLPHVLVDVGQIRQTLVSLLMNAAEAIGENTGFISVSARDIPDIHPESESNLLDFTDKQGLQNSYVFIEVRDTGCGMSAEDIAKIFEPFFTTKFLGRGLGLPAVLGTIRNHKGAISVHSEVGKGSIFRVFLPCA